MCAIIGFDSPTLTEQEIRPYFDRTISRGPDMSRMEKAGRGMLGFHRLAIMGLHEEGMQPFHLGGDMAVCNGELYGFRPLKKELEAKGYTFASESDCELILPLYREYGVEMFAKLDAEFAMIIYDAKTDRLVAARDPIGIRPLFYGYLADGGILFASEAKNLVGLCERIMPFPPGHYYADGKFVRYADLTTVTEYSKDDLDTVCKKIREKLIAGVEKRLDADAPLGFLLSGGLDSSLVCAISAKLLGKRIRTFAIGMDLDPIDLKYAREVADFIGAEHTEVIMTREQVLASLEEVVAIETTTESGVTAGPRAYLRPGTYLCEGAHVGTHVEIKKSTVGAGSKVPHLSYIGDTTIGTDVNIGAGSITCNYDGVNKHQTVIGDSTFVGSNTMLVAPVKLGSNVVTGAASCITKDVPDGALAVERNEQKIIENWTERHFTNKRTS